MMDARYTRILTRFADVARPRFRVLCGHPSCGGVLAELALVDGVEETDTVIDQAPTRARRRAGVAHAPGYHLLKIAAGFVEYQPRHWRLGNHARKNLGHRPRRPYFGTSIAELVYETYGRQRDAEAKTPAPSASHTADTVPAVPFAPIVPPKNAPSPRAGRGVKATEIRRIGNYTLAVNRELPHDATGRVRSAERPVPIFEGGTPIIIECPRDECARRQSAISFANVEQALTTLKPLDNGLIHKLLQADQENYAS